MQDTGQKMGVHSDSLSSSAGRPVQSGRKGSKKVRTGCITCKIRKVKCDEAKPFCVRCTKTGRSCDGYQDVSRAKHSDRARSGSASLLTVYEPHAPLTIFEWASAEEKRSFHFFQHVTAPCLSGDFDGDFWRGIVLRICQSEPAVKHAVLAVSSLHEGMVQGSLAPYADPRYRQSFALGQYNKAITCLLDQMREVDAKPLVPLLTCVLFVCIEFMQSKDRESLIHLQQGREILSRLGRRSTQNPEINIIKQHLVPVYTRLSLTSLLFGADPVAIPASLKMSVEVPVVFETIDDVRFTLYDFMDECLRFSKKTKETKLCTVPAHEMRLYEEEQDYLLRKLARFNVAFSLFQSTRAKNIPPGSIALIQIHIHTTFIWISTALNNRETAFDDHVGSFSAIIPLASSFIDSVTGPANRESSTSKPPTSTPSTPDTRRLSVLFTFEMHVIIPLYFVATKCRHPLIRRAALDLLRRNPGRRENLWQASHMAAIAEDIMMLEEKHLEHEYPEVRSLSDSPPHYAAPLSYPLATGNNDTWAVDLRNALHSPRPDTDEPSEFLGYETTDGPAASSGSMDMGMDSGLFGISQVPIDPSLLMDPAGVDLSGHSFCDSRSNASSFDDIAGPTIYVGGSTTQGMASVPSVAATSTSSANANWPAYSYSTPPEMTLRPPTHVHENSLVLGLPSHSRRMSGFSMASGGSYGSLGMFGRSADAPFDVPEYLRVREALIFAERGEGSRVMKFRKLSGMDAPWDVQENYVAVS